MIAVFLALPVLFMGVYYGKRALPMSLYPLAQYRVVFRTLLDVVIVADLISSIVYGGTLILWRFNWILTLTPIHLFLVFLYYVFAVSLVAHRHLTLR